MREGECDMTALASGVIIRRASGDKTKGQGFLEFTEKAQESSSVLVRLLGLKLLTQTAQWLGGDERNVRILLKYREDTCKEIRLAAKHIIVAQEEGSFW